MGAQLYVNFPVGVGVLRSIQLPEDLGYVHRRMQYKEGASLPAANPLLVILGATEEEQTFPEICATSGRSP